MTRQELKKVFEVVDTVCEDSNLPEDKGRINVVLKTKIAMAFPGKWCDSCYAYVDHGRSCPNQRN